MRRRLTLEADTEEGLVVVLVFYDVLHVLEFWNFNICCIRVNY